MISLLNNIAALEASNQLQITQSKLQSTLFQLSSGQRINSGADDAAGLAIANGLQANVTALTQSSQNANSGVGQLQEADGALAQVTTLLNRAVTLATESSNGSVSDSQRTALQAEYSQINQEIDRIGSKTNYNGTAVFTNSVQSIFLSDGASSSSITSTTGLLSSATLGLTPSSGSQITPAVASTATVSTVNGQPATGDTLTIGGTVYTFRTTLSASPTVANEVHIGTTLQQTMANLAEAVNGGANIGTDYSTGTVANATVSAVASGTTDTLTAKTAGVAGDATVFTAGAGNTGLMTKSPAFSGGLAQVTTPITMANDLLSAATAQTTLSYITAAIANVASQRGQIGADINRLQAASNVMGVQVQNLTAAQDNIMAANIPQQVTNLSEYSILNQSGISALAQANSSQQSILKLLQ